MLQPRESGLCFRTHDLVLPTSPFPSLHSFTHISHLYPSIRLSLRLLLSLLVRPPLPFYSCILRSSSISPINHFSLILSLCIIPPPPPSLPLLPFPPSSPPPSSPRLSLHPIYLENSAAAALKPTTN